MGTYLGGSTIFFADQMLRYNPKGLVITIDPKDVATDLLLEDTGPRLCPNCRTAQCHHLWHSGSIEHLRGRSLDAAVLARVREAAAAAQRGVVIHEAVLADISVYAAFVTPGSYLIVQDTALDRIHGKPMAHAAAIDFLRSEAGANF